MYNPEVTRQKPAIVKATSDDASSIFEVQRKTWLATYPNESAGISLNDIRERIEGADGELISTKIARIHDNLANGSSTIFIAKLNGKVVGFVRPNFNEEDQQYRLGGLYVLPETQGMGIGHALVNQSIDHLGKDKDIHIHVVTYNQNAINFYEKLGFVKTDRPVSSALATLPSGKRLPEIEMVRYASANLSSTSL